MEQHDVQTPKPPFKPIWCVSAIRFCGDIKHEILLEQYQRDFLFSFLSFWSGVLWVAEFAVILALFKSKCIQD